MTDFSDFPMNFSISNGDEFRLAMLTMTAGYDVERLRDMTSQRGEFPVFLTSKNSHQKPP